MSALPTPPLDQEPPEERPRPSRWKRIVSWIAAGFGVLVLLVVIGVVVLLHSQRFHNYIISVVQQQAGAALGLPVKVNNFALHFAGISPVVDMYGVVVNGAEPMPNPPLLQVEHIRVAITISSLLHRTWYINEVTVDRPVLQVRVNPNGNDNLPNRSAQPNQSSTSIFDLGIRHARLNGGEILYNDQKSSLEADLRNVQFRSTFNTNPQAYSGTLQYSDGQLKLSGLSSLPHDFSARFRATPTSFDLERAELRSGQSRVVLTGTVSDYSNPKITADYEAYVDATQLRRTLQDASLPTGILRLDGTMKYESRPGLSAIQSSYMEGTLSSPIVKVATASFNGNIEDLRAQYKLVNGRFYVTDIRGRALQGDISGNANVDLTQAGKSEINLQLQGASLAQLQTAAPQASNLGLGGTANVNISANWNKSPKNLVANIRANTDNASVAPSGVSSRIPLSGQVNATYSAANNKLTLGPTSIKTPQGGLTLSGGLGGAGNSLRVNLNNVNLQQIAALLPPSTAQSVASAGLAGTASFNGTVTGTTTSPRLEGVLQASNVRVNGTAWNSVRANVQASQTRVSIQDAQLRSAVGGEISLNLSAGLENWKLQDNSPLQVNLNVSDLGLASIEKLAGLKFPASGNVSADVQLHGTQLHPVGGGTVVLGNAVIQNQPLQTARLRFQADGQNVAGNLSIRLPQAGGALASFTVNPAARTYRASLQTDGLQLGKLQAVTSKNMDVSGVLTFTAEGQGSFDNPELRATAQVPQLEMSGQKISGLNLQANLANHVADVALNGQVVNAPVEARARVDLNNNYYVNATLNTPPIGLSPLFALYAPSVAGKISGRTQMEGTITGPLATPKLVQAKLTLPLLQLQYGSKVQIAAVNPVLVDYTNGVLRLQRTSIRGTATDLQVEGSVPLTTNEPMSLVLLGSVNLELAQLLDPTLSSSGQLQFNINSYGQRSDPNVEGQVQIVNANISSDSAPIGLQNGNGVLTLTKDRLNVTNFRGTVGGGSVTATGGVVYRPSLKFDLGLAGKGIKMLYPEGLRSAFDANLALTGTTDAALLRGGVQVEQLSFTPDFDLNTFMAQFGGDTVPPPTGGFTQNLRLDVGVQSTGGVNLVSRTLSLQATANLRAAGTAAQPVILGRVNISGGDLIFNGNRFVLEGGTIDFVNPARTEPVVNAGVNTTIDQYEIAMRFWGPMDQLHTNYSSVPALPPADIINLVAFGKTTEASAANPAAPGNAGAQSLLASQVASQVTSRVEKIAGISQLSVDPVLGSNQGQSPGARVTIRQRVTSNLFVTFASDVTSTQRQTIQVQYQFSPRLSFSGTRDQNGGFGFDTRIRKTW